MNTQKVLVLIDLLFWANINLGIQLWLRRWQVTSFGDSDTIDDSIASLNVSEMVNARLVAEDNPRTLSMLESSPLEKPLSIQVFGAETQIMEKALPKIPV